MTVPVASAWEWCSPTGRWTWRCCWAARDNAMHRAKGERLGTAVYDPALDDGAIAIPGSRPAVRTRDLASDNPVMTAKTTSNCIVEYALPTRLR